MKAVLDGASVLLDNWQLIGGILLIIVINQRLTRLILGSDFGNGSISSDSLFLSTTGWIVLAALLSLIWYFTGFDRLFWIFASFLVLFLLFRLKPDIKSASISTGLILALFVFLSMLLRLAFVSETSFPLYFDSAQHYLIIKNIMGSEKSWLLNWLANEYYHTGFHFLTAFLASIFQAEITQTMLILGQVILAVLPFSLFFLVRRETKSNTAGWFTVILSAFGWYMPAHAVDWGKYPALMSLGMMTFVLGLVYIISENKNRLSLRKTWMLRGMLGISILMTTLTHSRSLIVLGMVLLAWLAGNWWQNLPNFQKSLLFILVVVTILSEVIFIQQQGVLAPLFDPYLNKGILITAFALLFSAFAWLTHPRPTFIAFLTIMFLLAGLFIPVRWIPAYRELTLLDRPFVEMVLFLPLAFLGGLGLAGLEKRLQGRFSWGKYIGLLSIGIVAVNAVLTYDLYPSNCCRIVGNDDIVAMDWMANQLPADSRIGISSTELKVLASGSFEGDVGADAGIWVTPLTGQTTLLLPYDLDFDHEAALTILCQNGLSHLFLGELGQNFDRTRLDRRPEWYRPLLSMPKTGVYEVTGCD